MRYRIKFEYGKYQLQTPPCTSSEWDTVASGHFVWPLRVRAFFQAIRDRWYHRADGFARHYGTDQA